MGRPGESRWRALPPEVAPDELSSWCRRIRGPVAVTGGTGFIGSHVVDALLDGGVRPRLLVRDLARVREDVRGRVEVVAGSLEGTDSLQRLVAGCGAVAHIAGVVRAGRPEAFDFANRRGSVRLVEALEGAGRGARLVYVSSLAAAGPSPDPEGVGPEATPQPVSAYGRSKLAAEDAIRRYGGGWVIVRPPTTYGPRETDVLQFFRLAALGLVPIPAGERYLTVAHVADVARAILAALAGAGDGRTLHLGGPSPATLRDTVAVLAESGGVRARALPVPAAVVRVAGFLGDTLQGLGIRGVAMTSDKAREMLARHWAARTEESVRALGIEGTVPLAEGFAATWAWYRRNGWVPHAKIRTRNGRHPESE